MQIAQIAPLYEAVPPKRYGGTERVVANLSDELVRQGHDVTLFASGDSQTTARLVEARDCALRLDPLPGWDLPAHITMLDQVRRQADEFDVLHFHTDCMHMPMFVDQAGKTVTTLHGRLDIKDLKPFLASYRDFPLVSISNNQRRPVASANWIGTVYHGLPTDKLSFTSEPTDGYLAFLGRISPEKGPDTAIEIAKRAGIPLRIAAKVDKADQDYFAREIEPLLDDPLIKFVGEIGDDQKGDFLGNARALIFPIRWPEPFGLVMIEAMACGTPVIAFPCGSVPEIVEDGWTGRIVGDVEAAVTAVETIDALDRQAIRNRFEERFSVAAMARRYVQLYEALVESRGLRRLASFKARPAVGRLADTGRTFVAAQEIPRPAKGNGHARDEIALRA